MEKCNCFIFAEEDHAPYAGYIKRNTFQYFLILFNTFKLWPVLLVLHRKCGMVARD